MSSYTYESYESGNFKRNLMNELTEGIDALAERKDLEEWAFYESGLVAHGCLENIDEYMREAITRYGRLLLSKQKIKAENLEEDLETLKKQTEQCILMADKFLAELMKYREL